ncbi:hypothetical protein RS82_01806 [Microbacterium trichothecenolyticum]|uniref:Uncharacterized protein n=1 Tax=Microbacterium trichothecenolyticum TaxID=69370 RepID=A0A0M2H8U4_MICTR|nr:hypothetical protein RS82_01806 [Microbacterium trichothecenolyticum]
MVDLRVGVGVAPRGRHVVPHRVPHAEVGDDAGRRLLGERVGQQASQRHRGRAHERRVVRIIERDAAAGPLADQGEVALTAPAAGMPVGAGARTGVGARRGRSPARPLGSRRLAEAVPAVVRRAGLRRADELPRPLHLDEHRRVAAGVGVRLPQAQAIRLAEGLLIDLGGYREHLVGRRRERTVEHVPSRGTAMTDAASRCRRRDSGYVTPGCPGAARCGARRRRRCGSTGRAAAGCRCSVRGTFPRSRSPAPAPTRR